MNFFSNVARRLRNMFIKENDIGKEFGVDIILSEDMADAINAWDDISKGAPYWVSAEDDIQTINMAKLIADTRAKLTTLDIGIALSGSRAEFLQPLADDMIRKLPEKVAVADRLGGMIIKFNGVSWDFISPKEFAATSKDAKGNITGAIFISHSYERGESYTRLEYQRFENEVYKISNKAYKNKQKASGKVMLGDEIPLSSVEEWMNITPEVEINDLERPLFGYYRVPGTNIVDEYSPLGESVFANAIEELKAIDIAVSRKNAEIEDSKHLTFVSQVALRTAKTSGIKLPRFIVGLGAGVNDSEASAVKEHTPTLRTNERIEDINFDLSLCGIKCGFSEGVFVMNGQSGMVTATQIESDDRDTIQTIKAERDALKDAIEQAIDGANAYADLYKLAPFGTYEIKCDFGDITYSYEEDKASWKNYVQMGWVPEWQYFVRFEGMSEEEAKAITSEAKAPARSLFGEME